MRIPMIYWGIAYILGMILSWGNIYSMTFLSFMWGLCVLIYVYSYDKLLDEYYKIKNNTKVKDERR